MAVIFTIPNQQIVNVLFNVTSMANQGFSNEYIVAGNHDNQNVFPDAFSEGIEGVAVHPLWVTLA